jgi:hypothetical protein
MQAGAAPAHIGLRGSGHNANSKQSKAGDSLKALMKVGGVGFTKVLKTS